MNNDRDLLKQALEALERCVSTCFDQRAHEQAMSRPEHFVNQNITALRERLAQPEPWEQFYLDLGNPFKKQPEQAPVAWMQEMPAKEDETRSVRLTTVRELAQQEWDNPIPLYTTPPRREWVGLTDEEIEKGRDQTFSINNPYCPCDSKTMRKAVRWAEAKLREKNT